MVAALYRRYRPESFAELIGQSHVTDPLSSAIRADRVAHAYLFSGPRGCGKTTSARILARCLNCAKGPTPTPCGECDSCVELGRDGGGSLDVVEIDAASHNGVDDARDLRERAAFAPARDRFKIFILDEAHMVTSQGFNALLKIVEEPPPHVKFIFATTEPEKVIGTIRSRTHHYPFRLIPPAPMLEYVTELCKIEGVEAQPGVLPLVIRGGGGSGRDTLSLLDQLIAGANGTTVTYEQAVALLGYTHTELLDAAVTALGNRNAADVFSSVDRVIQSGQDPRRFVEDLLERLRDLIIVGATHDPAAIMHGAAAEDIVVLQQQAATFGPVELSRAADIVSKALNEMTGATSPRVHLELMAARLLVPAAGDAELGALARVERLERRFDSEGVPTKPASRVAVVVPPVVEAASVAAPAPVEAPTPFDEPEPDYGPEPDDVPDPDPDPEPEYAPQVEAVPDPAASASLADWNAASVQSAWPQILDAVRASVTDAAVVDEVTVVDVAPGDTVLLGFPTIDVFNGFVAKSADGTSAADHTRDAVRQLFGVTAQFKRRIASDVPQDSRASQPATQAASQAPQPAAPSTPVSGWAVAQIPTSDEPESAPTAAQPVVSVPSVEPPAPQASRQSAPQASAAQQPSADAASVSYADAPASAPLDQVWPPNITGGSQGDTTPVAQAVVQEQPATTRASSPSRMHADDESRYGESVVREELGAEFVEEIQLDGSR